MSAELKSYPWEGEKTEKIQIRVTPQEKQDIQNTCRERGGITVGQHLLNLHRKERGLLK